MQAITGDSVVLKIERARSALIDSLRRLEEIVPLDIGCQVLFLYLSCAFMNITCFVLFFHILFGSGALRTFFNNTSSLAISNTNIDFIS